MIREGVVVVLVVAPGEVLVDEDLEAVIVPVLDQWVAVAVEQNVVDELDEKIIELDDLELAIASRSDDWQTVAVYPDPATSYENVALVLGEIARAGVDSSEICLLDLERYRSFGKASFTRVLSIGPSGCDLLYSKLVA